MAVYTDVADGPDPVPATLVHNLIASRSNAIIVVDNCPPDTHRRLSEASRVPESTVSVITVEYDIREDQPEGTEVFELEASSEDLIERWSSALSMLLTLFPSTSLGGIRARGDFATPPLPF